MDKLRRQVAGLEKELLAPLEESSKEGGRRDSMPSSPMRQREDGR